MSRVARSVAPTRLALASLRGSDSGRCEPVRITGTGRFLSTKDRADAVKAMASVPWVITMPS